MFQEELYKASQLGPMMYCIPEDKIQQTLFEVHEGDYGHHIGGKTLALKITQAGTTPSNSIKETPFSLVCWTEAVLPMEVCVPSIRQLCFSEEKNGEQMRECLNFTDELRDQALYRMKRIRRVIGPGTYELEDLSGKAIKHTWHGVYLKKYYV
ncbi:hypothetical protein LIER_11245 [Lithospermum erythrorhizon]|uniref:Uncharacterized protein n=1 Tax=Lithospermum erythrorhizon TaxID=34254 RepID=A0AAV3PSI5_LITER